MTAPGCDFWHQAGPLQLGAFEQSGAVKKKLRTRRLGIVPRILLRSAVASMIAVVPACGDGEEPHQQHIIDAQPYPDGFTVDVNFSWDANRPEAGPDAGPDSSG